jgi:hypothetical protein
MKTKGTDTNRVDVTISVGKNLAGALPFVGPLLAAALDLIPGQRIDRIADFMHRLEERLSHVESGRVSTPDTEDVDLLEEGMHQAFRAATASRREYLANLVSEGLTGTETERMRVRKMLALLSSVDDAEILILRGYAYHPESDPDPDFRERHADIITPAVSHKESTEDEVEEGILSATYRARLTELNLLRPRFKKPSRDGNPKFDYRTGRIKAQGYEITPLGLLLLRLIGMIPSDR